MSVLRLALAASVMAFNSVVQASAPQPPTNVTAIADKGKVTVIWTAPTDNGGQPITSYTARYDVKGPKCKVSAKRDRCTVTGVKNDHWYTFYVTAKNKDGTSAPSQDSQVVIPSRKNVNAQCGTANGLYYPDAPPSADDQCLVGGGWPAVKGDDGIYYWSCAGFRQGESVDCKTSRTPPPPTFKVGDKGPAGGTVFYVTQDKQHGLEAASIIFEAKDWGCSGIFLGVTNTAVGSGESNTSTILSKCTEQNIAAAKANDEALYGFNDWFIPSKDEMELIISNRILNQYNAAAEFWTSSEISASLVNVYHRRVDRCPDSNTLQYCYFEYVDKAETKKAANRTIYSGYYNGGFIQPVRRF